MSYNSSKFLYFVDTNSDAILNQFEIMYAIVIMCIYVHKYILTYQRSYVAWNFYLCVLISVRVYINNFV